MTSYPTSSPPSPNTTNADDRSPTWMYRLSQIMVVGIPLTSILAGWMGQLQRPNNTAQTYNPLIHGINPSAEEGRKGLESTGIFLNQYSTDFSKSVQSIWRLSTVLPSDILRYGFRGFSQLYLQPLLEIVRRTSTAFSSPVVQEAILPTVNGKNLEGAKEFYPHLTHYEFEALKKEMEGLQLNDLEGLQDALLKDSMVSVKEKNPYKNLSYAMNSLVFNRKNPNTGHYEKVPLSHLPQFTRHIRIMTELDSMARQNATLSKYGARDIPCYTTACLASDLNASKETPLSQIHIQNKAEIQHELFNGPVAAYHHVVRTLKLGDFMTDYQHFLQLAAQGRLAHDNHIQRGVGQQLLNMSSTDPLERQYPVESAFLNHLFQFIELNENSQKQAKADYILLGRNRLGYIKHALLEELTQAPKGEISASDAIESVLNKLVHHHSLLLNDRKQHALDIEFDPQGALNLKQTDLKRVSQDLNVKLDNLRGLVKESHHLLNDPKVTTEAFRQQHQRLLQQFERERLELATIFPSHHHEGIHALRRVLQPRHQDAYTFVTQGIRHHIAMNHVIPKMKSRMQVPEVIINSILGFTFLGFVWNAFDVHRVQPYEAKMTDKKGNVKGAGLMLGLSVLPGISLFTGLMTNNILRNLTKNSPILRFLAATGVGLSVSSFCAYHLVRGHLEAKPDAPLPKLFTVRSHVDFFHHNHSEMTKQVKVHERLHNCHQTHPFKNWPSTITPSTTLSVTYPTAR
jgi:hypothetical protein